MTTSSITIQKAAVTNFPTSLTQRVEQTFCAQSYTKYVTRVLLSLNMVLNLIFFPCDSTWPPASLVFYKILELITFPFPWAPQAPSKIQMFQSLNPLILLKYNCQFNFFKWLLSFQHDHCSTLKGFPRGSVVKNPPINRRDACSILGMGRSPEGGYGNLLQYSCLENPMDRGAWRATVHGVPKSQMWLSD